MPRPLSNRRVSLLLALLATTLLGLAGWLLTRLPWAAAALPPTLPERLEWRGAAGSGDLSLLLHGVETPPSAVALLPVHRESLSFPGIPGIWRELFAAPWNTGLPEIREGFDGLQFFDLEGEPEQRPTALHHLPGELLDVAVRGQTFWLACSKSGLWMFDRSGPGKPALRNVWPARWPTMAVFSDNLAYLLNEQGRLEIIELKPSGEARRVARHLLHQAETLYLGMAVQQGQLLLLRNSVKINGHFLDACALDARGEPDLWFTAAPLAVRSVDRCWWRVGRLYLSDSLGGLVGFDVSTPGEPRKFLETVLPAQILEMAWTGRQWLVLLVDGSAYAFNAAPLGQNERFARYLGQQNGSFPVKLIVLGDRLFAFSRQRGIEVFTALPVPDRTTPEVAGELPATLQGLPLAVDFVPREVLDLTATPTGLATLEEGGRIRLHLAPDPNLPLFAFAETGGEMLWMTAFGDRLYVGGGRSIAILQVSPRGELVRRGEVPCPGGTSHAAAILGDTLCVAAGRHGMVAFSLADPDRPVAIPIDSLPPLLQQRADVRGVAAHGRELFAAAGAAGILRLTLGRGGGLELAAVRPLAAPAYAVAAADGLLLAASKKGINLLAMSSPGEPDDLQLLGVLPLRNVKRLTLFDLGRFGARQAVDGWQLLPLPVLAAAKGRDPVQVRIPASMLPGDYRLLLYNRAGVSEWPKMLSIPRADPAGRGAG